MATRSILIFADVQRSEMLSIYCHFDGYPEHMMKVLPQNYDTDDKVRELLNLGDASAIEPTLDKSVFYHRDRGEELSLVRLKIVDKFDLSGAVYVLSKSPAEYVYVYFNGAWECCRPRDVKCLEFEYQV